MNDKALGFFKNLAESAELDPTSVKLANKTDFTDLDAQFILKYANKESEILDLGSGTGLIVNKIYPYVGSIVCVEVFKEFTQFIADSKNITIVNQNLFEFETKKQFDIITAFGIMHYVNEEDSIKIYAKYKKYLKPNGILIVKNQFGLTETVNVSGYSEEQKRDYYSQYRWIETEKQNLIALGFKIVAVNDIYPKEANRWARGGGQKDILLCSCCHQQNGAGITYHYALVARV